MRDWAAHSTRILSTSAHSTCTARPSVPTGEWTAWRARASTAAYNCPMHADMRRPGVRPRHAA
eukprot:4107007-Prymnesium_polylepis.1